MTHVQLHQALAALATGATKPHGNQPNCEGWLPWGSVLGQLKPDAAGSSYCGGWLPWGSVAPVARVAKAWCSWIKSHGLPSLR